MDSISSLVTRSSTILAVRGEADSSKMSSTLINLLIALLVLVVVSMCLVGTLFLVRRIRRNKAIARQALPQYNETTHQGHRRLTITAAPYRGRDANLYVYDEKSPVNTLITPATPITPNSPVPEIRITFPDEQDEAGRRKSGRVVVVRVGERSVGLEPLPEDELPPAYEKGGSQRFHSIDMDRIGGLKEKDECS